MDTRPIPEALNEKACNDVEDIISHLDIDASALKAPLAALLAISPYAQKIFNQHPDWPQRMFLTEFDKTLTKEEYQSLFKDACLDYQDESDLMKRVRLFRHYHQIRIAWRLLILDVPLDIHLREVSFLAEIIISEVVELIKESYTPQYGTPLDENGKVQSFMVVAMGKLGGQELNFSSDVDLIFCYQNAGNTQGGEKTISNEQYFTLLAQKFIHILTHVTEDGFAYRVDLRLRPHGQSGPLVFSFQALEIYYQLHGRDWERYALIKARIITGSLKERASLIKCLQPFVYRKYFDYGSFESLRDMKTLVAGEVQRRQLQDDLKLGPGGIRQIEFIGQAFQLIRGGRERQFQYRQILIILQRLFDKKYISKKAKEELSAAYIFLRKAEHFLQIYNDEQTHDLPSSPEKQLALSYALKSKNWSAFLKEVNNHRARVTKHFNAISAAPKINEGLKESRELAIYKSLWEHIDDEEHALEQLSKTQFIDHPQVLTILKTFKSSSLVKTLNKHARTRLDKCIPLILARCPKDTGSEIMAKVMRVLQAIIRRSAYIALLNENPSAVDRLIALVSASEWITQQIISFPILLDELLRPVIIHNEFKVEDLRHELNESMKWIESHDLESQMEQLRQFKLANVLRLAASEITSTEEIHYISASLSLVAQVILEKVYELSVDFMVDKYGAIYANQQAISFGVIAYGNLGGSELNYTSDLDLVFVHGDGNGQDSDPDCKLTENEYYLRLAQRMIHIISTPTATSKLYDIDVRLRPQGGAGLLVTRFASYETYLQENAWVWEHQAFVRAQLLVGSERLKRRFEQLREHIFLTDRDEIELKQAVLEMREKMWRHLPFKQNQFDIKNDGGGLNDIAFIIQYFVLKAAKQYPQLLLSTKTRDLLNKIADCQLLEKDKIDVLLEAHRFFNAMLRKSLLKDTIQFAVKEEKLLLAFKEKVQAIWDDIFNKGE